jgi:NRAMP (natural resistance-associated macrophage protein)-like metal ion transporter
MKKVSAARSPNRAEAAVGPDGRGTAHVVKSPFWRKVWHFVMVFGPGLIVMEADNDAGAVSTYTQAGAQYGLHLLWTLLLLLPVTYFAQEMVVRLGIATGRGHADMIYKRFGKWWGRFSLLDLQLVNFFTLVTEFAAIALVSRTIGLAASYSVPIAAALAITLVVTGGYLRWEHIVTTLCLMDIAWIVLAAKTHSTAADIIRNTVVPNAPPGGLSAPLIFLVIAIVGTTIAPWQLFFQQSCVADKKLRFQDLGSERLDTFMGAVFTVVVAGSMMLVGNVLREHQIRYDDPAQMAMALEPFLGKAVRNTVLLLMVNASMLGTIAVSLASSWAYAEVMEWPHGLGKTFHEARGFYVVYVLAVGLAAAIVLIPKAPLQLMILGVQVLAGLILPSALVFLQLLLNDHELLGDYANKPWNNWINWTVIVVLFVLSGILGAQVMLPDYFSQT